MGVAQTMGLRARFPFLTTVALLAIIIASAVLGHLILQRVQDMGLVRPDPVNPELARRADYVVAYQCDFQICVTRGDGSGHRTLHEGLKDREQRTRPSMNESGRIAFECRWFSGNRSLSSGAGDLWRICTMNADGSALQVLSGAPSNTVPIINNSGQIAFICDDRICIYNQNPNAPEPLTQLERDGVARDPDLNDAGQVVFVCESNFIQNICLVDFLSKQVVNLTKYETRQVVAHPRINDAGVIVFECHDPELPDAINICLIQSDGNGARTLTRAESLQGFINPDINERGNIVFGCSMNGRHICSVKMDGTNLRQLTPQVDPEDSSNTLPSISNAGIVVFHCQDSVCIMRSDGSDLREIAQASSGDRRKQRIEIY